MKDCISVILNSYVQYKKEKKKKLQKKKRKGDSDSDLRPDLAARFRQATWFCRRDVSTVDFEMMNASASYLDKDPVLDAGVTADDTWATRAMIYTICVSLTTLFATRPR